MIRTTRRLAALAALVTGLLLAFAAPAEDNRGTLRVVDLNGGIGPASADFVIRAIEAAATEADWLLIRMDTPGGLDRSMRDIIKAILASEVPVITWVGPEGSRAASAGTYILYASHIAAMAPATNLGSATPVSVGGAEPPGLPSPTEPDADADDDATPDDGADTPTTGTDADAAADAQSGNRSDDGSAPADAPALVTAMERKTVNDAAAYIRSLAELRGRNGDWAEAAVRKAANLSANEALEQNVIDFVAGSIDELMAMIDGRTVRVAGADVVLATRDYRIEEIEPDWRHDLLATITDPSVAYLLLMAGAYGLLLEFYNPGFGVAGITGAICLLLGAYALQLLPINYAGLGLIGLGLVLMIAEALTPTLGVLGGGGLVAFVIGSVVLMDTELPGYQLSIWLILGTAASAVLMLTVSLGFFLRSRRAPLTTGDGSFVDHDARVKTDFRHDDTAASEAIAYTGSVIFNGEIWSAVSHQPLVAGDRVKIRARDGLVLRVAHAENISDHAGSGAAPES